jgi:hypothetical protein
MKGVSDDKVFCIMTDGPAEVWRTKEARGWGLLLLWGGSRAAGASGRTMRQEASSDKPGLACSDAWPYLPRVHGTGSPTLITLPRTYGASFKDPHQVQGTSRHLGRVVSGEAGRHGLHWATFLLQSGTADLNSSDKLTPSVLVGARLQINTHGGRLQCSVAKFKDTNSNRGRWRDQHSGYRRQVEVRLQTSGVLEANCNRRARSLASLMDASVRCHVKPARAIDYAGKCASVAILRRGDHIKKRPSPTNVRVHGSHATLPMAPRTAVLRAWLRACRD